MASIDLAAKPAKGPKIDAKPRVVSVNGVAIPRDAIARETQNHAAKTPIEAWKMAARALAIRELLLQEAHRLQIDAVPIADDEGRRETSEEAALRAVIEQEIVVPKADDAVCRRYFEQNRGRFRSKDLYEVAHILIAADPKDTPRRLLARAEAEAVLRILIEKPVEFALMAQTYSACPSGKTDGNLGQIGPGSTVPEFEAALGDAEPGRVHPELVESRYGFHIIRVDRKVEGRDLPFELVRERIADYLDESVRRRAMAQYVSILAGRAEIVGIDLAAADSPLLQ